MIGTIFPFNFKKTFERNKKTNLAVNVERTSLVLINTTSGLHKFGYALDN